MPPTMPGQRATVLVTLAATAGTPTAVSMGNEISVPPPATRVLPPRRPRGYHAATRLDGCMHTRKLGYSGLQLTPIGLGTWAMGGGGWLFGWGAQDDSASVDAIRAGLDAGVNWIDTAAIYGHGHAEEIVGRAAKGRRDQVIIATKCGRVWEGDSREIQWN